MKHYQPCYAGPFLRPLLVDRALDPRAVRPRFPGHAEEPHVISPDSTLSPKGLAASNR